MFRRRRRPLAAASTGYARPDGTDVGADQRTDVESDDRPDDRANDGADDRADDFAYYYAYANADADCDARRVGDHVQSDRDSARGAEIGLRPIDGELRRERSRVRGQLYRRQSEYGDRDRGADCGNDERFHRYERHDDQR